MSGLGWHVLEVVAVLTGAFCLGTARWEAAAAFLAAGIYARLYTR